MFVEHTQTCFFLNFILKGLAWIVDFQFFLKRPRFEFFKGITNIRKT